MKKFSGSIVGMIFVAIAVVSLATVASAGDNPPCVNCGTDLTHFDTSLHITGGQTVGNPVTNIAQFDSYLRIRGTTTAPQSVVNGNLNSDFYTSAGHDINSRWAYSEQNHHFDASYPQDLSLKLSIKGLTGAASWQGSPDNGTTAVAWQDFQVAASDPNSQSCGTQQSLSGDVHVQTQSVSWFQETKQPYLDQVNTGGQASRYINIDVSPGVFANNSGELAIASTANASNPLGKVTGNFYLDTLGTGSGNIDKAYNAATNVTIQAIGPTFSGSTHGQAGY